MAGKGCSRHAELQRRQRIKQKNKVKLQFFKKCKSQFLRLNKGLDHTKKWQIYQKVKDHVRLPELYATCTKVDEFPDFAGLTDRFCIKGDKGEQGQEVLLITKLKNGKYHDTFHNKTYCRHTIKQKLIQMLKRSGRLMFEQWLYDPKQGGVPYDYKIHVVGGKIFYIWCFNRNGKPKYINFFDQSWKKIKREDLMIVPVKGYKFNQPDMKKMVPTPEKQKELTDTALRLWEAFRKPHYARFDLYLINNVIYFGEVTVICGGLKTSTLKPQIIDSLMKDAPWRNKNEK